MQRAGHRLDLAQRALHSVSPLATLGRGYAIVSNAASGALLRDANEIADGAEIETRLGQGRLRARVLRHLADDPTD
jgi:exodeoxyribonuclease VII large subunit